MTLQQPKRVPHPQKKNDLNEDPLNAGLSKEVVFGNLMTRMEDGVRAAAGAAAIFKDAGEFAPSNSKK
jgi:hypothetical protein